MSMLISTSVLPNLALIPLTFPSINRLNYQDDITHHCLTPPICSEVNRVMMGIMKVNLEGLPCLVRGKECIVEWWSALNKRLELGKVYKSRIDFMDVRG